MGTLPGIFLKRFARNGGSSAHVSSGPGDAIRCYFFDLTSLGCR